MNEILEKSKEIHEIIHKNNGNSIKIFGSVANDSASENSDIDFLVKFNKNASLFDLVEIKIELEDLLGNKVDVVSENGLKNNDIGKSIKRSAISI
ncbi:nucleotidyltransferase family protein [Dethiosulfatibacter aminovorans]|uniref:nucleotidyltransferase family protein n=1 Tax=Dethiosulfatibacter aminovorans TaxID=332095 RepID=UPI001FE45450|nr:nucleotidyltransferase family protein [Dethiosulfatibacter aminovorans]